MHQIAPKANQVNTKMHNLCGIATSRSIRIIISVLLEARPLLESILDTIAGLRIQGWRLVDEIWLLMETVVSAI